MQLPGQEGDSADAREFSGQVRQEGMCDHIPHIQGLNSIEFQQDVLQNFQQITVHSVRLNALLKITLNSLFKFN